MPTSFLERTRLPFETSRQDCFLKGATVYIIDTCSIPLAINKLGRFARNIYLPTVRTNIFSLGNNIMYNIYEIIVIF